MIFGSPQTTSHHLSGGGAHFSRKIPMPSLKFKKPQSQPQISFWLYPHLCFPSIWYYELFLVLTLFSFAMSCFPTVLVMLQCWVVLRLCPALPLCPRPSWLNLVVLACTRVADLWVAGCGSIEAPTNYLFFQHIWAEAQKNKQLQSFTLGKAPSKFGCVFWVFLPCLLVSCCRSFFAFNLSWDFFLYILYFQMEFN